MRKIVFLGRSLELIREFPSSVKQESGYELDKVQRGLEPKDWKSMSAIGPGVREIRIHTGGTWRLVYVVNRKDAVYVLHAFQKKTQKTTMRDVLLIKSALKELK